MYGIQPFGTAERPENTMDPITNRTVYRQQIYMGVFYEKHYFYRAAIRIYNYKYYMIILNIICCLKENLTLTKKTRKSIKIKHKKLSCIT